MSYTLTNLELPVVQKMLRQREHEMDLLVERKSNLLIGQATFKSPETVEAQLAETSNALTQITTEIAAMPDGEIKNKAMLTQLSLQRRKLSLEIRLANAEGDIVPDREYELKVVEYKISELTVYISELQAKRDELTV